jgi:CBS domain-containing protein
MGTIANVLADKGNDVHTIAAGATVYDAVARMVERNVGALLVLDGDRIGGIVSERDYLRQIVVKGRTSKTTRVEEIMTSPIVYIGPSQPVEEAMAIMNDRRIRHLPVVDEGQLIGLVSIGDLVKQVAKDRKFHIQYLTDYICGKYPA